MVFINDMKINNVNNVSPGFKGYKNFLANSFSTNNDRLLMFSAQLDNNQTPDLAEYQKILSMDKRFSKGILHDDVLSCFFMASPTNLRFCLNLRPLLFGSELSFIAQNIPKEQYRPVEKLHLKAFTLLARFTRQIQNKNSFSHDKDMSKVVEQAVSLFKEIGHQPNFINDIIKNATSQNALFKDSAETLNRIIDSSMRILLR